MFKVLGYHLLHTTTVPGYEHLANASSFQDFISEEDLKRCI